MALLDSLGTGSEATAIDHFSFFVERAVMAPDISKVDTDRHLNPGPSVWNFRDEVLRRVFHGNSLSPARKTCSSHFSLAIPIPTNVNERIGLIWSDRVNGGRTVGLFLSLPLPFEDRASSSRVRFKRRLISLIFAGRNRIIMIRRELPLIVIASPAEPVA